MTCILDIGSGALVPLLDGLNGVIWEASFAMQTVARESEAIELALAFERNPSQQHVAALISARSQGWAREPLTAADLCGWHRQLFPAGGYYRTSEAHFSGSGHTTAAPDQIAGALLTLVRDIDWLLTGGTLPPALALATAHWRFECIHPFSDGNGRVGRVLLQYMAGYAHLPPVCLKAARRAAYIDALERGDVCALAALFLESM